MKMNFADFSAVQVRIARPTDRFEEVTAFYEKGLGLKKLGEFSGHAGYKGVMLGLPNALYHLDVTRRREPVSRPDERQPSRFLHPRSSSNQNDCKQAD